MFLKMYLNSVSMSKLIMLLAKIRGPNSDNKRWTKKKKMWTWVEQEAGASIFFF